MKLREVLKLGKGYGRELTKGILKENPVFRLVLGTCPTLAVSTSAMSALGMGAAATVVLICSNLVISTCRKIIPDKVRIPAYITIIAGFVSVVQMLVKAFVPAIDKSLGIYLPLIVVNCIILGRAEAFASKNKVLDSALDGLGMGLGYTVSIVIMSGIRQLLATGALSFDNPFNAAQNIFTLKIIPDDFTISMFSQPVGAFCTFACLAAGLAAYKSYQTKKAAEKQKEAK